MKGDTIFPVRIHLEQYKVINDMATREVRTRTSVIKEALRLGLEVMNMIPKGHS